MLVSSLALLSFSCVIPIVNSRTEYPLGISLGPKYISAAVSASNGTTITPVAQVTGNEAYRSLISDLTRKPEYQEAAMVETVAAALAELKKAAEISLHRPVDCTVISLPEKFDVPTIEAAAIAAGFSFMPEKQAEQILWFPAAVHIGYDLGNCTSLGLAPDCDEEDVLFMIWVDYTGTCLDLRAMEVTEHGVIPYRRSRFSDLGDDALGVGFAPQHPRQILLNDLRCPYSDIVGQKINSFITENFAEEDTLQNNEHRYVPLRAQVRAVVLTGEASPQGFDCIRTVLRKVSKSLGDGKLRDTIEPSYVAAVGAARRARDIIDQPKLFNFLYQFVEYPVRHNEL